MFSYLGKFGQAVLWPSLPHRATKKTENYGSLSSGKNGLAEPGGPLRLCAVFFSSMIVGPNQNLSWVPLHEEILTWHPVCWISIPHSFSLSFMQISSFPVAFFLWYSFLTIYDKTVFTNYMINFCKTLVFSPSTQCTKTDWWTNLSRQHRSRNSLPFYCYMSHISY